MDLTYSNRSVVIRDIDWRVAGRAIPFLGAEIR
jgi:hypothetical protein